MASLDPSAMDDDDRDRVYGIALEYLDTLVQSADSDPKTGELILWGRWGPGESIEEERFQKIDDLREFLASFGWRSSNRKGRPSSIALIPYAENPIVDVFDADDLIESLIRDHDLESRLEDSEFAPAEKLFDFRELSRTGLASESQVELIAANDELIRYLASHPNMMHELTPRRLEEVVAEIFDALGFEVILTPRTRDGGCDVRAVRKSSLGTLLYLIECKRYAPDRPIGVELVRGLYGTVMAERASHGILATTSYFSRDAKQLADSLRYQVSLRDYNNLKAWLQEYRGDMAIR